MNTPVNMINQDDHMIERMEVDLLAKIKATLVKKGLSGSVHGVFSLDDLENKTENDLQQRIAVGVGYSMCQPGQAAAKQGPGAPSIPGGPSVRVLDFYFQVILAVPTGPECKERYNATQILTVLRRGIQGTSIAGDTSSRTWAFEREAPQITESSDTLLYYQQLWKVTLPITGNLN